MTFLLAEPDRLARFRAGDRQILALVYRQRDTSNGLHRLCTENAFTYREMYCHFGQLDQRGALNFGGAQLMLTELKRWCEH